MANNLVYCNDCADNNRNVYPAIPGDKPKAGAPELCDGIDNTCSSGSTTPTPTNDGSSQCGSGGDAGKPDCCSVPMLCVNKMTDFKHCGGCDSVLNVCSATTADACVGGACKCSGTPACSVAGSTICKPGQGCVDCLKSADCKDLYPGVTLKAACSAGNKCVECAGDGDCSGNASKKTCDLNTNRCVVCKDDTQCLGANKACLIDVADTTNNTCVQCTAKKFCTTNPGNPACDLGRHTCIPCNAGGTDCTVPTATQCKPDAGNNTSLNSCVQCLGDGDCKTPGLTTCNPATNLCVPCLAGLGCAVGKCLVNPNPANNSCVQCLSSTDCAGMATAKTCDPTVHKCVDCDLDADCMVAGKPACSVYMPVDPVQNMCVECLADKHCMGVSGKPACYIDPMNVANNRCVPCLQGDGCVAPTPVCKTVANPSNNFCVKCLKDMGCIGSQGGVRGR